MAVDDMKGDLRMGVGSFSGTLFRSDSRSSSEAGDVTMVHRNRSSPQPDAQSALVVFDGVSEDRDSFAGR